MVPKKGVKHDDAKPRWDLLPLRAVNAIVDVLTYGAQLYGKGDWKRVENGPNRYYAALMRHLTARVMRFALFLVHFELAGEIDELGEE